MKKFLDDQSSLYFQVLNDILTFALHFCQLSPFAWLLMEAVYFVNTTLPLFDYENTNSRKFYMSLGWGKSCTNRSYVNIFLT